MAALAPAQTRTSLVITNNTKRAAQVFVVLAAMGGACSADNPPVTADQLKAAGFCGQVIENPVQKPYAGKCQFELAAGASKTFPNIPQTCISGNVTFGGYPACPDVTFPNCYTTAEFTLNPSTGAEDVDVSLVNGFNFKGDDDDDGRRRLGGVKHGSSDHPNRSKTSGSKHRQSRRLSKRLH